MKGIHAFASVQKWMCMLCITRATSPPSSLHPIGITYQQYQQSLIPSVSYTMLHTWNIAGGMHTSPLPINSNWQLNREGDRFGRPMCLESWLKVGFWFVCRYERICGSRMHTCCRWPIGCYYCYCHHCSSHRVHSWQEKPSEIAWILLTPCCEMVNNKICHSQ